MSKHQSTQRFVMKIDTNTLKQNNWNLRLSYAEAQMNEQVIALADSTCLRFIDSIRGVDRIKRNNEITNLRSRLKILKNDKTNCENKKRINEIYNRLNELSFTKDYLCLIANNKTDYKRAVKGFTINGIKYVRLLGTAGQLKQSIVVFVNSEIHDELLKRLENGRNVNDKFIPAKYNSYLALACSSSTPVSEPNVIVVKDCMVKFTDTYVFIKENDMYKEPTMEIKTDEVENNINDGFGLISPKQAKKWSEELQLDYTFSGCCIRNAFLKGMLYQFDFHEFAKDIAKNDTIIDIWGDRKNIFDADIIITESMLKLWSSYNSYEHYHDCCISNGFSFSITKVTPKLLDNVRNLNYQYLQSYELSDKDINELVKPTIDNIKDILCNDVNKTILYLKGYFIGEKTIDKLDCDFVKALMIDERMINDPFVQNKLKKMIKKKINDAKIGVLQCNGNFTLLSGDPYALCQSMFGLKVSGLLKANEFYSNYWNKQNVSEVVGFRSPMSCHNNIRKLHLINNDVVNHWYKYMSEVTIINAWDLTNASLNGCDFDGDLIFTTNNEILLNNTKDTLPIVCEQKKGEKLLISNKNLIESDMRGFGDEIGKITNRITEMFDVKANFNPNSEEYKTLEYRIKCGQKYQQDAIDKIKGIECKSMPKPWYDKYSISKDDNFDLSIVANKKPYFFIYNYIELKRKYNNFQKLTSQKALMLFGKNIHDLLNNDKLSDDEKEFMYWYHEINPISDNDSTMNKICHKIEKEFSLFNEQYKSKNQMFDKNILKRENYDYSLENYSLIKQLYEEYKIKVENYIINNKSKDTLEKIGNRIIFCNIFKNQAYSVCNNKYELANILVDLCYSNNNSKQFAWDICGDVFIENLLLKNNNKIKYLEIIDDENYNDKNVIEYNGRNFIMKERILNNEKE